jgi:hypothetical protein
MFFFFHLFLASLVVAPAPACKIGPDGKPVCVASSDPAVDPIVDLTAKAVAADQALQSAIADEAIKADLHKNAILGHVAAQKTTDDAWAAVQAEINRRHPPAPPVPTPSPPAPPIPPAPVAPTVTVVTVEDGSCPACTQAAPIIAASGVAVVKVPPSQAPAWEAQPVDGHYPRILSESGGKQIYRKIWPFTAADLQAAAKGGP